MSKEDFASMLRRFAAAPDYSRAICDSIPTFSCRDCFIHELFGASCAGYDWGYKNGVRKVIIDDPCAPDRIKDQRERMGVWYTLIGFIAAMKGINL